MGLNDIELPASVLASLYPSSLVTAGTTGTATPEKTSVQPDAEPASLQPATPEVRTSFTWKFLGNNKKAVLVVVNHRDIIHLPDDELNFLTTMLTACKLSLGDIILVNYNNIIEKGGPAAVNYFKSRQVLLFGIEPADFGLAASFPEYQVQGLANVQYLYSPALSMIADDQGAKKKLWVSLKKLFGI